MKWMQRSIVALLVVGVLSICLSGPVAAQSNEQNGLVNVFVGDDLVQACVPIQVAVDAVVELCNLDVDLLLAVLGRVTEVDTTGKDRKFCKVDKQPVIVAQDTECD